MLILSAGKINRFFNIKECDESTNARVGITPLQ
jgi:hypothetical protein